MDVSRDMLKILKIKNNDSEKIFSECKNAAWDFYHLKYATKRSSENYIFCSSDYTFINFSGKINYSGNKYHNNSSIYGELLVNEDCFQGCDQDVIDWILKDFIVILHNRFISHISLADQSTIDCNVNKSINNLESILMAIT